MINELFYFASESLKANYLNLIKNNDKILFFVEFKNKNNIMHSLAKCKYNNIELINFTMNILKKYKCINKFLKQKNKDGYTPWELAIKSNIINAICIQYWADNYFVEESRLQNISRHVLMISIWEKFYKDKYPENQYVIFK